MTRHVTTVEECRTALKGALASPCFARSTRQRRLLEHLVTRLLEGQVLSLKESALASEFFGRTADKFDPVKDTAVPVEARPAAATVVAVLRKGRRPRRVGDPHPSGTLCPDLHASRFGASRCRNASRA